MSYAGLVILLFIASGAAWGVYVLVGQSLRRLLNGVVQRSAATEFYLRAFLVCLLFGAWSTVLSNKWEPSSATPIMEEVWTVAGAMSSIMWSLLGVLILFLVLVTILTASLARKSDEPPACLNCGYSLKGLVDNIHCPECGAAYSPPPAPVEQPAHRHEQ